MLDYLARHCNGFSAPRAFCFDKRRKLGKSGLTGRNPLLHRALVAPQHLCPGRLPDAAEIDIKEKLHLPCLKTAALHAALDQFLDDSIELAELYVLDQLLFHHLNSGPARRKLANSVVL